ncbi:MAG TPA: GNAT family N-acetyltransferase [Candidatus Eisenbacteria bacterium]
MIVRAFLPADIPAVRELWSATDGLGFGPGDAHVELESFLARNPGLSPVAVSDDVLVGALLCGHDGRRGCLYRLAVAASHRRRGVAGQLVRHALDGLRAAGIPRALLYVLADNAPAAAFWKSIGGRIRGELDMFSIDLAP